MPYALRYKLNELPSYLPEIWERIKDAKVIALKGDLGAGKTTFTRALCHYLRTDEPASSPTFSIINEYRVLGEAGEVKTIYHTDWYRIENREELVETGIEELFEKDDALCIVEWPQKFPEHLPPSTRLIQLKVTGENSRILQIDPPGENILEALSE